MTVFPDLVLNTPPVGHSSGREGFEDHAIVVVNAY